MVDITCIADLHGFYPTLPGGDLLILAGDYTAADKLTQWSEFFHWLAKQRYQKKIIIGGNHDNFLESGFPRNQKEADELKEVVDFLNTEADFEYLCDSGTEFEWLKIWGTPWTKTFKGMNPKCKAFTCNTENELYEKFKQIPGDIDILICHGPPYGILDGIPMIYDGSEYHAGSTALRNIILDGAYFTNLKHVIFGHIHEQGGKQFSTDLTTFTNCSYVNEYYKPMNKPVRIEFQS